MELKDILELILMIGSLFFILGYLAHDKLRQIINRLQQYFLKPKYLKSSGLILDGSYTTKRKNR